MMTKKNILALLLLILGIIGFATYQYMPTEGFHWVGQPRTITEYASSPTLIRTFCGVCGSVVPGTDDDERFVYVPAGCHEDGAHADCHIFAASKAPWYEITDDLPQFSEMPKT